MKKLDDRRARLLKPALDAIDAGDPARKVDEVEWSADGLMVVKTGRKGFAYDAACEIAECLQTNRTDYPRGKPHTIIADSGLNRAVRGALEYLCGRIAGMKPQGTIEDRFRAYHDEAKDKEPDMRRSAELIFGDFGVLAIEISADLTRMRQGGFFRRRTSPGLTFLEEETNQPIRDAFRKAAPAFAVGLQSVVNDWAVLEGRRSGSLQVSEAKRDQLGPLSAAEEAFLNAMLASEEGEASSFAELAKYVIGEGMEATLRSMERFVGDSKPLFPSELWEDLSQKAIAIGRAQNAQRQSLRRMQRRKR